MSQDVTPETSPAEPDAQPLADRGSNRAQRPGSPEFVAWITSGWGERPASSATRSPAADHTASRRSALSGQFSGERLVVPAGTFKVRSNDTDYRFRPHSAFAHLTGLGVEQEPDAVLVLHPVEDGAGDDGSGHHAVLYVRPLAGRDTDEFFSDSRYGEFWVGARPTLEDLETTTGITTRHIDDLRDALAKDVGPDGVQVLVVPGADETVEAVVEEIRAAEAAGARDEKLAEALSELRLIKDAYEIEQMQLAVDVTIEGFVKIVSRLPVAQEHERGERVIEGTFVGHARQEGNAVGYETIAAAGEHATTLHWIDNDGPVRAGELVLIDAGVEVDSLYTADVTRTLPVDGTFTEVQRRVYQAVLDAADAAFAVAVPGARFRDIHAAAMEVIAHRLADWGLLPVTAEEALDPEKQHHRRWMVHGTSHHLGIDVHDCALARSEHYLDAVLEPGMVFTIEPGLYFKSDDLVVPAEYRGIGVRIEDDVLITADGNVNLSAALPREPDAIEAWMADLLQ
ncbi:aminopeptidase P family protein [Cellulomonas rhizosphaerae]|uniref:Xaa-Pro aminopeptidase n=1 Tax=Cellulomonas rhizosphaerae TaxID=2293719 RepID=A0A413RQI3_9CELL|nr:aminopeptidase P family protein [Cellulomonas rhizosphaerae]RHA44252.1 aminopeptidase P family protein [Cellulomonas rhizosphaerae]